MSVRNSSRGWSRHRCPADCVGLLAGKLPHRGELERAAQGNCCAARRRWTASVLLSERTEKSTHYDDLRSKTVDIPRILVVLFLPEDSTAWLTHSADQLVLKRCAYWVNLRGAEPKPKENKWGVTIKLPKAQVFSPDGLRALITQLAKARRDEET